jgi:hypothetical protein
VKYAEASCHEHGEGEMYYDGGIDEWCCSTCQDDEYDDTEAANLEAYNYGRG